MKRSRVLVSLLLLLLVISGCNFLTKGTITGSVKDLDSGAAIPGATITLKGTTTPAVTTNSNGVYQIERITYGNVELIVAATGYVTKTVAVTVDAPIITVNVNLEKIPLELADAKKFVKDFRTSLYEMGTIALAETGVVSQFKDEVQQFFGDIAPYTEELAYGLEHLYVIPYGPGEYEFVGWDFDTGEPVYELIEEGNLDGTEWIWKVTNPFTGMVVEIYSPNVNQCLIPDENDGPGTIDFTNTEFGYIITSSVYVDAVYTGQVQIGNDNVQSYQLTDGEEIVIIKVPSGKTATANFVIDPKTENVGSIKIDASFDLTDTNSDLKLALDGTVTTPVFTYTGNLTVDMKGVGTVFNVKESSLKPFTVTGTGTLENSFFESTGYFSADIIVVPVTDEYGDEILMCLPAKVGLEGSYTSTSTEYLGAIQVELLNGTTFSLTEMWMPQIKAALYGEVKNLANTYLLNLEATFTDGQNVALSTRMTATNKYDLAGTFNINLANGLTEASMVNENGLFIDFDVAATSPNNIGGIYRKQNGLQFASIAVVIEDTENPFVSVNFTDNTSEIVPLNPLVYLIPQG